ncbi:unnamed protein product (macronuclear) [Paramecium tetraurelia]|uniref:Alpha-type protein kinase domain-containing protein n=1 Tax=Paramecium tetraurelia TaxID=5888 RepID=A0CQW5_PARTE|nr:uncharacterized protein GSPATT00009531001 [Paramecium tetraurelia]CAK73182.1 unnamed protein product [Paramecium tetraurelia]|eukprot:XP_001440579.1 hypothetical protein (macronuclear) [Paramecium tetraurelia strain d4-2]
MDNFCTKLHPRAFAGICIGFLNNYCQNQSICGLQHFSIEQLRDKIQQHPINGIRQYNLCPTNCQDLNCRYLHPPWLKNVCLQCLNKKKQCKGEPALIHKVTWDKLRDIVYKEYSISGANPEMFCDEINCNCPAKIYNFDQFCIKNFKGICPMLDGRCIKPHKSWESLQENSLQKVKEKAIVARGCIKFDEKDKSFIKQQQKQQQMQVFIEQRSLLTMVNQIELRPQVDIIFIIDCTISMEDWLIAAKHNIKFIIKEFTKKISVSSCVRIAAVCYRDFTDGPNHIQYHDFTVQPEEIEKFIDKFQPKGGEDIPEDLIGALDVAYNLNISKHPDSILQIFTITDAPCHGRKYHSCLIDDRPDTNNLEEKLENFVKKKKRFFFSFISIKQQTDKMEEIFKKCVPNYSSAKITENKFSDYVLFSLSATMHKSTKIEDDNDFIFREVKYRKQQQMNYSFEARNGSYMNQFRSQMKKTKLQKKRTLLQIEKSELNLQNNEKGQNVQVFKAFDQKNNIYVIKKNQFITEELQVKSKNYAKNKYQQQLIAKQLSHYFNQQCDQQKGKFLPIYYATPYIYYFDLPVFGIKVIYGESYIDLDIPWQKYSNNADFFDKEYNFTTFSHFTYVKTNENLIITDLQGKSNLLSDPCIHSKEFEDEGNCQELGKNNFFQFQHQKCTPLCITLKLGKNILQADASQLGQYEQISDVFGGKTDQSKLQKICANCNCQEKLENLINFQEICSGCLEKKKQEDVCKCECCNEEFKIAFNYQQLQETFINFCKNCKNSECNFFNQQCHYCQSKICKQTEKTIQIQNKTYYICLDAFHYLRQIKCIRCLKEYQFQKLLTKEEYCDNHYNYICNACV